jgi:hypothetical protein
MSNSTVGDAAIAVVRRNTEEVQGKGNWDLYEELFADDFVDHTPQPGTTPDKNGVRVCTRACVPRSLTSAPRSTGRWRPVTS